MSKGSGRRRITPSDGLHYDEDSMMTNIEERGGSHFQSAKKELRLGIRTGAPPTADSHYGTNGKRWGGRGRKNDNRNWKTRHKGKQYEHNLQVREAQESHKPVPENVANRMREKSINSDLKSQRPCKAGSAFGRMIPLRDIIPMTEKFLVKFGGPHLKGVAARRAQPYQYRWSSSNSPYYLGTKVKFTISAPKTGWAKFEETVSRILRDLKNGWIDSYGFQTY